MSFTNSSDKVEYDKKYYLAHKVERSAKMRELYLKYRESRIAKSKQYYERNKQRHFEHSAQYRKNHPDQALAHAAIANAVVRGKLVKPTTCQDCNREARIESHHYLGYEKENRLNVLWLCRRCHMKRHHG